MRFRLYGRRRALRGDPRLADEERRRRRADPQGLRDAERVGRLAGGPFCLQGRIYLRPKVSDGLGRAKGRHGYASGRLRSSANFVAEVHQRQTRGRALVASHQRRQHAADDRHERRRGSCRSGRLVRGDAFLLPLSKLEADALYAFDPAARRPRVEERCGDSPQGRAPYAAVCRRSLRGSRGSSFGDSHRAGFCDRGSGTFPFQGKQPAEF